MVKNSLVLKRFFFLLLGFSSHLSIAQNSINGRQFSELSAFENFQIGKYQSVIGDLKSKDRKSGDEEILLLLSELKTGKSGANEIEDWLSKNPKHPIKPLVSYHLGEYFFYKKDTLRSKKYLSVITPANLTGKDRASYGYVYGLLKLGVSDYKEAKNLFRFSRKNGFEDLNKLDYYEGFADYHLGSMDKALVSFQKVEDTGEFGNSSRFFIAKIKLENGEIDQVIAMAQNELSDEKTITNSGFYQLIGEAYAFKNLITKANVFFERAIELHPEKPSAALYYQAGVSKFKIGNEDAAIQFLTEASILGSEHAQLSAFQLGRLYLNKQQYEKALSAYIEASASQNEDILEESYFQVASINAKLGYFARAINYANDYLSKFKDSEKRETVQNLIAQCYLRTSNYDLAIEHLNNTGITNSTQKEVYQKITFQKAILSFNDASFNEAGRWFRESLKFVYDQSLKNSANYHLAEIALRNNRFDEAIRFYKNQSTIDPISYYGIGYALYNKQQYSEAIPHFRNAKKATEPNIGKDASVRLADCLYATKSYQEAFNIYDRLSGESGSVYLIFQKAMALKNLGRRNDAITTFKKLFSHQKYGAQARFQSGMIQFESANFSEAELYFSEVINNYVNSDYVVESLLNRGISKKNMGELEDARSDYEIILNKHTDSEIALNAILGLQELHQAGLNIRNLDKYINQYKNANPDSGNLELIEFEAAKRLYFDISYQQVAIAFEKYLKDYPANSNKIEAMYYQADSYYRIGKLTKAKSVFDELRYVKIPLTGRILNRLGEINKRLNNLAESEEIYKLLIDLNLSVKDTYNARQGLMFLYFDIARYNDAITGAEQIIATEWKPLNAEQEATMVKAKSWIQLGNMELAQNNFKKLSETKDAYGAEASYNLGLIAHKTGEYKKSLDLLFNLNTNYGSYTQWVNKSYLLIARNYMEMDKLFQAKATLRSIIQHAKNEEVKNESQILLHKIELNSTQEDSTQIKD